MSKKIRTGLFACLLLPVAVMAHSEAPLRDSVPDKPVPVQKPAHLQKPVRAEKHKKAVAHKPAPGKVQYGVASYYANKFEGRKTYTDEIFSQKKLTAASNTLPMHTWVRVTNLRNHRTCIVRINDKMHPLNHRLIDLSHEAASRLGYAGRGLTHVRVDVLGKKRPPEAEAEMAAKEK